MAGAEIAASHAKVASRAFRAQLSMENDNLALLNVIALLKMRAEEDPNLAASFLARLDGVDEEVARLILDKCLQAEALIEISPNIPPKGYALLRAKQKNEETVS